MSVEAAGAGYPLRFDVQYPEALSRWKIFVKWLLAIPHFAVVYVVAAVMTVIAFFSILFTGKYPEGLFRFVVNVSRWNANLMAYVGLMRDEYPPFSWDPGQYPVTYDVDYPPELKRWAPLYKWLLAVPHLIALLVVFIIAYIMWVVAFFAILFTGRFPKGPFDFIVGALRWNYRVSAYTSLLRDEYPPFSTS